jgi:two-component system, sensor histidine kinase and response regulator
MVTATKPKILVVDDKHENLFAIETVLKDLEVELVKVNNGNDALKATLHHQFALALLDVQMPGMDGYELASILREEQQTASLPFIFISAVYTDNLNVFKGYEKGAFSFITKPFQPEVLINKVKFFVEKHQQEAALRQMNIEMENKNRQLEAINKELDAFSYSISHDLRAPLRSINGFTIILKEDYEKQLDEEGKKLLEVVHRSSMKMTSLVDDLLNFSRLGKQELKKIHVDMNELVKEIIKELTVEKTELIVHELPDTEGDSSLLRQAIFNLVSNAVKYSGKNSKPVVEIGCQEIDGEKVYYVKDNGVGFDMKYADKLFGVFQRLHHERDFEGTGAGLAIVQRILNRHGGRIWAEAEVNKGATFYFSLPMAS